MIFYLSIIVKKINLDEIFSLMVLQETYKIKPGKHRIVLRQ